MFSYTGIVLITAILLSLLPTVRTVPDLSQQEWIRLDEDLQLLAGNLHHDLGTGGKLPHHAANEYSDFLLKIRKERDRTAKVKKHEDLYRKNFFKFAKQATNGTIDNPNVGPTYSRETANIYYPAKYSHIVPIDPVKLFWFPKVTSATIDMT